MKRGDVFPSRYLKSEDLGGGRPIVTIKKVVVEEVGQDRKPVMHFQGKNKTLVMNRQKWDAMRDITGTEESDDWAGRQIMLQLGKTMFKGKSVPCIDIVAPVRQARAAASPPPPPPLPPPAPEEDPGPDDDSWDDNIADEDEVPF